MWLMIKMVSFLIGMSEKKALSVQGSVYLSFWVPAGVDGKNHAHHSSSISPAHSKTKFCAKNKKLLKHLQLTMTIQITEKNAINNNNNLAYVL